MNTSPRGVRTISVESYAPFTIIPNAKIPDLSSERKEQMAERTLMLLRKPRHQQPDFESTYNVDALMSAPLTM